MKRKYSPRKTSIRPSSALYWYDGDLTADVARSARSVWASQKTRCYNIKSKSYKTYGLRGIRVLYSCREFVGWYIENIVRFVGREPSVGRVNHDGHYEFSNIEIQSKSQNSKERVDRLGTPVSEISVLCSLESTGEPILTCKSLSEAARLTGVAKQNISSIINSKRGLKSSKGFVFSKIGGSTCPIP